MNFRNAIITSFIGAGILTGAAMIAQRPAQDVSAAKHPNLAAAQKLVVQAYDKITAAQKANEWDMEGHAARAKDLLDQANQELKLAAAASNNNRH